MLNEPDDAFDAQLATGWDALAPPSDARARVRARLAASGVVAGGVAAGGGDATAGSAATARGAASFTRAIARRWQALLSSGGVGASVAVSLLGVGFFAGYRSSPSAPAADAPSAVAAPAVLAVPVAADPPAVPVAAVPVTAELPPAPLDSDSRAAGGAPSATGDPSALRERRPARAGLDTTLPSGASPRDARSVLDGREKPPTRARAPIAHSPSPEELLLLERAERALRTQHPALATVLIDELTQRFPRSPLHEERRAIELMARCQMNDGASAAAGLRTGFAHDYPTSVYSERIERACGSLDDGPSTNGRAPDTEGVKGGHHAQTP